MTGPNHRDRGKKRSPDFVLTDHFEGIVHECQQCPCDNARKHCSICLRELVSSGKVDSKDSEISESTE